ncbi:methyltransferase domain-containing protein [Paenibacillus sp. P96]|uniref:Methyltransferase domain-containing protein n=1 Tax=Paenibacillus zeirhizosphaerae TaxID=2987519 RepID=A0ABT9FM72_9BACL|nr:methyltransferase domain-containing protein [Paenibacillus sp. P96]MDP4095805.1 methyltransferase domain-containing protein [Paenibacillus sp. P96]
MSNDKEYRLLTEHVKLFACPLCATPLQIVNHTSLVCAKGHCYDIARQGYVNWLSYAPKTKYDQPLFESRRVLHQYGLFASLTEAVREAMIRHLDFTTGKLIQVMDAGCGEGSHLLDLQRSMKEGTGDDLLGVGVDISKEGIRLAAKAADTAIWCAADLTRAPFADGQFHCILNILSPSSYAEFKRLLTDEGMVIKVVPESGYLQELREALHGAPEAHSYSNHATLELFQSHFKLIDRQRVQDRLSLDRYLLEHLLQMTPLAWRASAEDVQRVLQQEQMDITVDLSVLIGKLK